METSSAKTRTYNILISWAFLDGYLRESLHDPNLLHCKWLYRTIL